MELSFESPKENAQHLKLITEMYDFNKNIVQCTVKEFYVCKKYPMCQIKRDFDGKDWLFQKHYIFMENFEKSWILIQKI